MSVLRLAFDSLEVAGSGRRLTLYVRPVSLEVGDFAFEFRLMGDKRVSLGFEQPYGGLELRAQCLKGFTFASLYDYHREKRNRGHEGQYGQQGEAPTEPARRSRRGIRHGR